MVRPEQLLARLHRRRFARICARHPCAWAGSLEATAESREQIFALAELIGKPSTLDLAATCRTLGRAIGTAGGELALTLPPMVYVMGGEDDDGQPLSSVERLCPTKGVWESAPSLRAPRKWCAGAAAAGHIYVVGGWGADDDTLDSVDRFDPWRVVWEEMPAMSLRRGAAAAAVLSTSVLAIGGQDGELVHASAEALDLPMAAWRPLPPLRCARHALGVATAGRSAVYAIGGLDAAGEALGSVERLELLEGGAWVEAPPLRTARAGLAAAATASGCVMAVGGRDGQGRELCSLEVLDLGAAAWHAVAPLAVPRWGLGAAACCGRLYALGGTKRAEDACIGACEGYAPKGHAPGQPSSARGGSWAFIACLQMPRRLLGACATR